MPGIARVTELLPEQVVEVRQVHPRVFVLDRPLFHRTQGHIHLYQMLSLRCIPMLAAHSVTWMTV